MMISHFTPKRKGWHGGDIDGDSFDDIFISNVDQSSRLYRNVGGHLFEDVTKTWGLPELRSSSAFFADYDNDGRPDLFVVEDPAPGTAPSVSTSTVRVFRNLGNRFVDVTSRVIPGGVSGRSYWLGTMSFADYNNDGWLDFVIVQTGEDYNVTPQYDSAIVKTLMDPQFPLSSWFSCDPSRSRQLEPDIERVSGDKDPFVSAGFDPAHGCIAASYGISVFSGERPAPLEPRPEQLSMAKLVTQGQAQLFENRHGVFVADHSFSELVNRLLYVSSPIAIRTTNGAPTVLRTGEFWQPISFDYDGDNRPDIFFALDGGSSLLLHNEGGFAFENVTSSAAVSYAGTAMGADIGYINNDTHPDLFVTNELTDYLYRDDGQTFSNVSSTYDLSPASIGWGASFLDYDLDGWEDLYIANGDINKSIDTPYRDLVRPFLRSDKLYHNVAGTLSDRTGADLCPDTQGDRPLAVSDFNNDGTPDIFVGAYDGSGDRLLTNETAGRHYVAVRLVGTKSNRMGVGAVITASGPGNLTQTRQLIVGSSFFSENSQKILFGLGTSTQPVRISVRWPSGLSSTIVAPVDTAVRIVEGE